MTSQPARTGFVTLPGNPCPEGGVSAVITASDNVKLRAAHWSPETSVGTVFFLNGRTEFIEKYFETIGRLLARSYRVYALDWRGQGLSDRLLKDPQKGHVGDFVEYEHDLSALMGLAAAQDAPRPWLVLAHSMGGHNALRFAMHHPGSFDGLALCAPMLRIALPEPVWASRALVKVLAAFRAKAYAPGQGPFNFAAMPFAGNPLTSDAARFAVMIELLRSDPALQLGGVTSAWLARAFDSMRLVTAKPAHIPAIFFSATADRIVDSTAHREVAALMNASLVEIAGAQHEILREADIYQDHLWRAFDTWRVRFKSSIRSGHS